MNIGAKPSTKYVINYDGEAITYDQIGNPLTYKGYNLTWQGRRLQALSGNDVSASYTYNEEGLRTSKTVNNVVTNFAYNGSLLMAQTKGNTKLSSPMTPQETL